MKVERELIGINMFEDEDGVFRSEPVYRDVLVTEKPWYLKWLRFILPAALVLSTLWLPDIIVAIGSCICIYFTGLYLSFLIEDAWQNRNSK